MMHSNFSNLGSNNIAIPLTIPAGRANTLGSPDETRKINIGLSLNARPVSKEIVQELNNLLILPPHKRTYKTYEELVSVYGVSPADETALKKYFKGFEVAFSIVDPLMRTATISGDLAQVEKSLNTKVAYFSMSGRVILNFINPVSLPSDVAHLVTKVEPVTQRRGRGAYRAPTKKSHDLPLNIYSFEDVSDIDIYKADPSKGYSVIELAKANDFPEDVKGKGQAIAVIELGGEYNEEDIKQYFKQNKIRKPKILTLGTAPDSTGLTEALNDSEVTLDLEVLGAIAQASTLIVYYGQTIVDAMSIILNDDKNRPSVVSISWAGSEDNYSKEAVQDMNYLFYLAALMGITVIAASGDTGAYNGKKTLNVNLPASHPLVIGCGGTIPTLDDDGNTVSEVVWNEQGGAAASGGGFSKLFPLPQYQYAAIANYPYAMHGKRGVPDIAADASTVRGYKVVFNHRDEVIGGTSGATPFIAALIALLNEKLGYRLGYINPFLYQFAGTEVFHQITKGNNNYYPAHPYWNAATGLGNINGKALFEKLKSLEEE